MIKITNNKYQIPKEISKANHKFQFEDFFLYLELVIYL